MKARVSMKLICLVFALAFISVVTSTAGAQPGTFVKGVLQPLADGFPKRPLTIIVPDDPGTRDGIYARTLQESLRSISPVPVLVSDEPVAFGGTFYKMQELLEREGGTEGYYPTVIDVWGTGTDPLIEPITKELGMTIDDLQIVIVTETIPYVLMQRKNTPWGPTFAGLVKYAKANPGKVRYISKEVGSGFDIGCSLILSLAGILDKVEKIPQGTTAEVATAVASNMGDFCNTYASVAIPHIQAGKADLILFAAPSVPAPWDKDKNVVTMEGAGLPKMQLGAIMGIGVPKQVSKEHVDWLYKLFKAAASTDLHKKREQTNPGLVISIVGPADAEKMKKEIYAKAEPVVRSLGLHVDQKK